MFSKNKTAADAAYFVLKDFGSLLFEITSIEWLHGLIYVPPPVVVARRNIHTAD